MVATRLHDWLLLLHEGDLLHLVAPRDVIRLLLVEREQSGLVARPEQLEILLEPLAEQLLQQLLSAHRNLVRDAAQVFLPRDIELPEVARVSIGGARLQVHADHAHLLGRRVRREWQHCWLRERGPLMLLVLQDG